MHVKLQLILEIYRDNLIKLIANKGGVIGLNFAQSFLGTSPISRIEDIVKHELISHQ